MKFAGFLLLSQVWLLDPCVIWMGAKALDCDNAGSFVSDIICAQISLFLLYFRSFFIIIAVYPYIEACRLDSVFGAKHDNEVYGIKAHS